MAGRAGRRGKDTTGTSILYIDSSFGNIPTQQDLEQMLESKGQPLESKLNLSYKLILNIAKTQNLNITEILNKSFFENEN